MAELSFLRSPETSRNLSSEEASQLVEGSHQEHFESGTTIIGLGEEGDALYVLLDGEVEVRIKGDDGRTRFTRHLRQGDIFGEMAVLTGEPRTADVVAVEACTCLRVDRASLEEKLRTHPTLAAFLTDILGRRMLESNTLRQVGKYHLLGVLGHGSMATVFEGYHRGMNRPVAIKMLSHSLVHRIEIRRRFRDEARILAGLRHENIVQVYDLEEAYRTWFIVMEHLPGMDLERHLAGQQTLEPIEARWILYQVASALAYAHEAGVVHRDVKPANLFRLPDGTIRVVDFGIASEIIDRARVDEGTIFCSPAYVAPEVVAGTGVDGRADLYSLGATAYRLLTGSSPFPYEETTRILDAHVVEPFPDPALRLPDLPEDLAELIRVATRKEPEARFQSAREIVELLAPRVAGPQTRERCALAIHLEYPLSEGDRIADLVDQVQQTVAGLPQVDVSFGVEDEAAPHD